MPEPTTSSAAVGAAAWNAAGGAAGVAGLGAVGATVIVMLMTPPRSVREWAVGLISTVLGSICGGAAVVQYFNLHTWLSTYVGLVAILGVAFTCGLPAWALVRALFTYLIRRQEKDLAELIQEARAAVRP